MQKMTTLALIITYERSSASAENGDFGKMESAREQLEKRILHISFAMSCILSCRIQTGSAGVNSDKTITIKKGRYYGQY